jgi:hypothetical protein
MTAAKPTDLIRADLAEGVRVSAEFHGETATGTIRTVDRRGSHYRQDGTVITLGTVDTVHIDTDQPVTSPTGRTYHAIYLHASAGLDHIQVIGPAAAGADLPAFPGLTPVRLPDFTREAWTTTGMHRIEVGDIVCPCTDRRFERTVVTEITRRTDANGREWIGVRGHDLAGGENAFNRAANSSILVRCDARYVTA